LPNRPPRFITGQMLKRKLDCFLTQTLVKKQTRMRTWRPLVCLITLFCAGCAARPYPASEALKAKFGKPEKLNKAEQERAAGENEGRAEVLNAIWQEQAIEGKTPAGTAASSHPYYRRVWVPERVVNGVTFRSGYQTVLYYK
jgi:hypothetical protein